MSRQSIFAQKKMDRIRPEKIPRQRVQKLWRNVRWAESFPDESITMDLNDITPNFALRKVALLFENKKYQECASLIRRLNCVTLSSILREVPVEVLHDSLPQSLVVLEAIYVKIFETSEAPEDFPREELHVDQLLQRLVALFAKQSSLNNKTEKNSNSVYPSCRNILRVVTWIEPHIRRHIRVRKKALEKCLRHLGRHGLVASSDGNLMNLHDALKVEFDIVVNQYRNALQKLDELSLSVKHPMSSSVSFGPAPTSASHQRLMQVSREDVQSRIIKNKTLYNIAEPAVSNQCLRKLIHILEKRIEYDKIVLFHDTELRKIGGYTEDHAFLSASLKEFSQGYATVLQLLREVAEEDRVTEDEGEQDDVISSDEDAVSPLLHVDMMKALTGLNGIIPPRGTSGGSTGRGFRDLRGGKRSFSGSRPSVLDVSGPFPSKLELNGMANGHATLIPHSISSMTSSNGLVSHKTTRSDITVLEQEVENLQAELEKSQEVIKHLQAREVELMERLSQQAHSQFSHSNSGQFENLSLGANRPTELIQHYENLYTDGRVDAMDSLDAMEALRALSTLKGKILFSIVVLSFRSAQQAVQELRGKLRHLLNLPLPGAQGDNRDPVAIEMEGHLDTYLCKTINRFDLTDCIQEVLSQIYATLYDYPCLKECAGLQRYVTECVQIAWGLSVQNPPYQILYDSRVFQPDLHTRFHTSNANSDMIQCFLWPALLHGQDRQCVQKAVVET